MIDPSITIPECTHRGEAVAEGIVTCSSPEAAAYETYTGETPLTSCMICPFHKGHDLQPVPSRKSPTLIQRGWNLTKSLAAFTVDAFHTVSKQQYKARLDICETCDKRQDNWCQQCGCNLSIKAHGRAFDCPLNKWPEVGDQE